MKLSARGLDSNDRLTRRVQGALGDKDCLVTTGSSRMSNRQIALWETGALGNVKMTTIDQTSGVLDG